MYNKFIAIGRLTKDVEARVTPNGKAVANFSIATNPVKDETFYIHCVAWGKLAEICEQYFKKGSKIYLEGRLQTNEYEYHGEKKSKTVCNVDVVKMLDEKQD